MPHDRQASVTQTASSTQQGTKQRSSPKSRASTKTTKTGTTSAQTHGRVSSIAASRGANMLNITNGKAVHDPSLPSPSKNLDHPTYGPGARLARLTEHEKAHPTSAASTSYLPHVQTACSTPMDDELDSGVGFDLNDRPNTDMSFESMGCASFLDASGLDDSLRSITPPTPSMTVFPPFESREKPQHFSFGPESDEHSQDPFGDRPIDWIFPSSNPPSPTLAPVTGELSQDSSKVGKFLSAIVSAVYRPSYAPSPSLSRSHPRLRHGARSFISYIRPKLASPRMLGLGFLVVILVVFRAGHHNATLPTARQTAAEKRIDASRIQRKATELAAIIVDKADTVAKVKKGIARTRPDKGKKNAAPKGKAGKPVSRRTKKPPPAAALPVVPQKPIQKPPLLGLDQIPRRYAYGANFVVSEDEQKSVPASDRTNKHLDDVLSPEQLKARFKHANDRYFEEKEFWQTFVWTAPNAHESLERFLDGLDENERALREWTYQLRINPSPPANPVGLAANESFLLTDPVTPDSSDKDEGRTVDSVDSEEDGAANGDEAGDDDGDDADEGDGEEDDDEEGESEDTDEPETVEPESPKEALPKGPRRLADGQAGKRDAAAPVAGHERKRQLHKRSMPLANIVDFFGGSLTKWGALAAEDKSEYGGLCAGSTWLDEYKQMHEAMLLGEKPARLISYHCEHGINCGGLGDRLLGMTSAFFFGLVTNRAFLAEWQVPTPIDVIFDSPAIDWSYSTFDTSEHPVLGDEALVSKAADLDIIHFDRRSMDRAFGSASWVPHPKKRLTKGLEQRDIAYKSPWIRFFSNRGMIYRASSAYQHLQPRLQELGLKPQTTFGCILNYLFRPKPAALDFISQYTSVLTLPTVFSVGIQIRTGDASMKSKEYDAINTVGLHKSFFRCADQLAETYALPDQKVVYFLVTDSAHLREDAQKQFADRIIVSGAGIEHVHQKTTGHANGVMNAVLEDWILAKTDYRVITQDSGFGKIATFASGRKSSTVSIFPGTNGDLKGLKGKNSHVNVDCRLESAFVTMDELSNEWSLG